MTSRLRHSSPRISKCPFDNIKKPSFQQPSRHYKYSKTKFDFVLHKHFNHNLTDLKRPHKSASIPIHPIEIEHLYAHGGPPPDPRGPDRSPGLVRGSALFTFRRPPEPPPPLTHIFRLWTQPGGADPPLGPDFIVRRFAKTGPLGPIWPDYIVSVEIVRVSYVCGGSEGFGGFVLV